MSSGHFRSPQLVTWSVSDSGTNTHPLPPLSFRFSPPLSRPAPPHTPLEVSAVGAGAEG